MPKVADVANPIYLDHQFKVSINSILYVAYDDPLNSSTRKTKALGTVTETRLSSCYKLADNTKVKVFFFRTEQPGEADVFYVFRRENYYTGTTTTSFQPIVTAADLPNLCKDHPNGTWMKVAMRDNTVERDESTSIPSTLTSPAISVNSQSNSVRDVPTNSQSQPWQQQPSLDVDSKDAYVSSTPQKSSSMNTSMSQTTHISSSQRSRKDNDSDSDGSERGGNTTPTTELDSDSTPREESKTKSKSKRKKTHKKSSKQRRKGIYIYICELLNYDDNMNVTLFRLNVKLPVFTIITITSHTLTI